MTPPEVLQAPSDARYGKFVRVARLGAGGGGEVWKAWDTVLSRWVALKFLRGGDPEELARFRREAQLAGHLSHPNIAAIYEAGDDQGRHFIAMQWIDGATLKSMRGGDPRQIARLVRDAARAVHAAHEHGVIHRDLKPENLMASNGHLFVMDFGLARAVDGGSVTGTVLGTPAYMSPEQARGERADARSDIYALGATLYELLTGRRLFDGASIYEVLRKVESDEPASPTSLRPALDADLATIALKCIEKDRDRRYATAAELADDLDRWLAGEPVAASPPTISRRLRRALGRRRGVLVAAAAGLLLVAAVLGIAPLLLRRTRHAAATTEQALLARMRNTAETCLKSALDLRRAGNVKGMEEGAIALRAACVDVQRQMPSLAEPHHLLGRFYRAQMKYDEALAEQQKAIDLDPAFAPARFERGLLRIRAYDAEIERLRDAWCIAKSTMRRPRREELTLDDPANRARIAALEDLEPSTDPLAVALVSWLKMERRSVALLEEVARTQPDLSEAWDWLARAQMEYALLDEAARTCSAGLEFDRGNVPLLCSRITLRMHLLGREPIDHRSPAFRAVLADCDEAIRLAPSQFLPWQMRALVLLASADRWEGDAKTAVELFEKIVADFVQCIRCDPRRTFAFSSCGMARTKLGNWQKGARVDPTPTYEAALRDLDEALRLDPTSDSAYEQRGAVRFQMADWKRRCNEPFEELLETALRDCERAVELNPARDWNWGKLGEVRLLRAQARVARKEDGRPLFREAVDALAKAVRLNPVNTLLRELLAIAELGFADATGAAGDDPTELYASVIIRFNQVLEASPRAYRSLESRGAARLNSIFWLDKRRKDVTASMREGILEWNQALAIYQVPEWYARRALLHKGLRQNGEAIADLTKALEIAPGDWSGRGYCEREIESLRK